MVQLNCTLACALRILNLLSATSILATNLVIRNPNDRPRAPMAIFGDIITNHRFAQLNVLFAYSLPTDKIMTAVTGTGTINGSATIPTPAIAAPTASMAQLQSGTNGTATISSKAAIQYIPGHDTEYLFTAKFTPGVANSTQWIGAYNISGGTITDGFAIGYQGATFGILHNNSSSDTVVSAVIPQANFNIDPLNGDGPSGINLVPTNLNIFKISFGWLGTAPIICWIMRQDGTWWKFHVIQRPNNFTLPSVNLPFLRLSAQVTSSTSNNVTLATASWNAGTIGKNSSTIVRSYALKATINNTRSVASQDVPVLYLTNTDGPFPVSSGSKLNYANAKLISLSVAYNVAANVLTNTRIIKNPTLTGTSTPVVTTNYSAMCAHCPSIMQYALLNTTVPNGGPNPAYTANSGTAIIDAMSAVDSSLFIPLHADQFNIVLLPGESLIVTTSTDNTNNYNAIVSLTWQEPVI